MDTFPHPVRKLFVKEIRFCKIFLGIPLHDSTTNAQPVESTGVHLAANRPGSGVRLPEQNQQTQPISSAVPASTINSGPSVSVAGSSGLAATLGSVNDVYIPSLQSPFMQMSLVNSGFAQNRAAGK